MASGVKFPSYTTAEFTTSTSFRTVSKAKIFQSPKSPFLLSELLRTSTKDDDIVLDFFAGSGTLGHATMMLNSADQGRRRFVLVQLPEPLDAEATEQRAAVEFCRRNRSPLTISEITKERLRRSGAAIKGEGFLNDIDVGFRVFKLDATNIREWSPSKDKVLESLVDNTDHLKLDRTEADILYEVLLKLGLDLCVPIVKRTLAGKEVHSVGGGVLIACLATRIARADVEALGLGIVAWRKELATAGETTCLFRDSAFEDDVAKTNLAAILEQNGITTVRSL